MVTSTCIAKHLLRFRLISSSPLLPEASYTISGLIISHGLNNLLFYADKIINLTNQPDVDYEQLQQLVPVAERM